MAKPKLPATTTVTVAVLAQLHNPGDPEPGIVFSTSAFSEESRKVWAQNGYFFVKEEAITIRLPEDFDVVKAQLSCMKDGINAVRAEFQNRIAEMTKEMQKFEALAWNGVEA